ncbi:hypothetical protein [Phenylobacterium sp.]|uniref:hypothetical protein n=1 Tax=Phenylobacterium sp. TaxID=1871053 RepID=UPI0039834A7C
MPFFCYVHRTGGGVPHFEVLPDMPRAAAIQRAADLLAQRPDGERAELWEGEELVFTLAQGQDADLQVAQAS